MSVRVLKDEVQEDGGSTGRSKKLMETADTASLPRGHQGAPYCGERDALSHPQLTVSMAWAVLLLVPRASPASVLGLQELSPGQTFTKL